MGQTEAITAYVNALEGHDIVKNLIEESRKIEAILASQRRQNHFADRFKKSMEATR